ncbi:cytochrome c biogenesis CcdA family protein [Thalassobacillus pellis]|uniref:cytochrome c biogenesis CcdA family protein n=1 Tax=Thalassobacillus pellis TaxID=748008 RepID=UPI0019604F67|nr:cytochrome c biogenesis protein CcdA [Thalassobacillus pellis]MBM7553954.1 cytochrome c-type biogenesis protein [Thalassobacillus pellis]
MFREEGCKIELSIWLVFGAGILSFISPCVYPLYPSYLSFITGISVGELSNKSKQPRQVKQKLMLHTLFFVLGLSIVFFILGSAFTFIGDVFTRYQNIIRMIGAVFIIGMGFFLMGIFQPISMIKERRLKLVKKPAGYLGSFLVGVFFAAGWTPCIGPMLTAVLTLSASNPDQGLIYTLAYTLGFAIPFLVMSFFLGKARWILKYSDKIMKISGGVMVMVGLLLYFDKLSVLGLWLTELFGGFRGF